MGICSSTETTSVQKVTVVNYQLNHEADIKSKLLKIEHRELVMSNLIRRAKKLNARYVSVHPTESKTQLAFSIERAEGVLSKIKSIPKVVEIYKKESTQNSAALCKLDMFLTNNLAIFKNAMANLRKNVKS